MATIKDVARLAGVSTTTVSHVMNKTRFVAEKTTQKVWAAVDELNYAPSAVARSLKCNSTRTIGMLVTKSNNPFFAEVVRGVESHCYDAGYTLILCNTEGNFTKQQDYLRMLAEKRVDGLLVLCTDLNTHLVELLRKKKSQPMVVMNWGNEHLETDSIQDNAELGGYLATKHLLDHGHRRIACISGQLDRATCSARLDGYKKALEEMQIAYDPQCLVEADFECDSAIAATKKLLALTEKPTAIFCFNDIMALAAISTIRQHGFQVPEDISIVGYDNIDLAAVFSPPLTTIHQPKKRLGKMAVELLLERIQHQSNQHQVIEIKPELVLRKSVKTIYS